MYVNYFTAGRNGFYSCFPSAHMYKRYYCAKARIVIFEWKCFQKKLTVTDFESNMFKNTSGIYLAVIVTQLF